MSKLSNRIRIVSSDGEVIEEAGKEKGSDQLTEQESDIQEKESIIDKIKGMIGKQESDIQEKESIVDKIKGMIGKKDKEEYGMDDSEIGGPDVSEKQSIVDRVKRIIRRDKEDDGYDESSKDSEVNLKRPRTRQGPSNYPNYQAGGQNPFKDLEEDGGKKKINTPILIGIIVTLAVVGITTFIYTFNSSTMAPVEVKPQQIEDVDVEQILEGEHEEFTSLVDRLEANKALQSPSSDEVDAPQEEAGESE